MATQKKDGTMTYTKGKIPMIGADGRKYKVRNPTPHDFTADPTLTGKMVAKGSMVVDGEDRNFAVIETGTMLSLIYESKALEDVFRLADIGDTIEAVYQGVKDLGGGRSFKRFSVAVFTA